MRQCQALRTFNLFRPVPTDGVEEEVRRCMEEDSLSFWGHSRGLRCLPRPEAPALTAQDRDLCVVVGGDLVVRIDKRLDSAMIFPRLANGALVWPLSIDGTRMHYRLSRGVGPTSGWVSTVNALTGRTLVVGTKATRETAKQWDGGRAVPRQSRALQAIKRREVSWSGPRPPPEHRASALAAPVHNLWRVVGGDLIVRSGKYLDSPMVTRRLACGAVVRPLNIDGTRMLYALSCGTGPSHGWVSTTALTGKRLLEEILDTRAAAPPEEAAGGAGPGAAEPGVLEPEPGAAERETTEPEVPEPEAAEPDAAEPRSSNPAAAPERPDVGGGDVWELIYDESTGWYKEYNEDGELRWKSPEDRSDEVRREQREEVRMREAIVRLAVRMTQAREPAQA